MNTKSKTFKQFPFSALKLEKKTQKYMQKFTQKQQQ